MNRENREVNCLFERLKSGICGSLCFASVLATATVQAHAELFVLGPTFFEQSYYKESWFPPFYARAKSSTRQQCTHVQYMDSFSGQTPYTGVVP